MSPVPVNKNCDCCGVPSSGGGGGVDLSLEIAEGVQSTLISAAANGAAITGPTRNWSSVKAGGAFAAFDDPNNRLVALQAGRYRLSWHFGLDANRAAAGVGGGGVTISGSVMGQIRRPTDFRYHPAANSDLTFLVDGMQVVDLAANESISASVYSVNLSGVDVYQSRMTLEYLGAGV
jgi:hypothetical protein